MKNEQGKSVRDQIIELKAQRNETNLIEINAQIERLKKHLGKTDKKIEKVKAREKIAESESNAELALLLHLQKYILRLTKHIDHLIESVNEENETREDMHFHRLTSRVENISTLAQEYDQKYR